jgi:hypothetical protein
MAAADPVGVKLPAPPDNISNGIKLLDLLFTIV